MGLLGRVALPKLTSQWKSLIPNCANPDCELASVLHNFSRRRQGLKIGSGWYCCPDCVEQAACAQIAELCHRDVPASARRRFRVPLGLVLLSRGVITHEQLQRALAEQRTGGGRIGEVLTRLGFASEEQVTLSAAVQWGCPVISLKDRAAETEIKLPHFLLELHSCLPVYYAQAANKLIVGFVQQIDRNLLSAIEEMTATVAVPACITPSDFQLRIRELASNVRNEEVTVDSVKSPSEMARIVRNYAVQIEAAAVRFTRCREYIWSRLQGARQEIELLFKIPGRCDWGVSQSECYRLR